MCVMRAHTQQAQAEHHTGARAAVRLSERSAAEREKEGDAEESSSNTDPQAASGAELGGEITAVLKKYFIAEQKQFVGIATSSV